MTPRPLGMFYLLIGIITIHTLYPDYNGTFAVRLHAYKIIHTLRYASSSSRLRFVPESAFVPGPQLGVGFC